MVAVLTKISKSLLPAPRTPAVLCYKILRCYQPCWFLFLLVKATDKSNQRGRIYLGSEGTVHGRRLVWGQKEQSTEGSSRGVAVRGDSPREEARVGTEGTVHSRRPVLGRSPRTQSTQEARVGSQSEVTVHGRKLAWGRSPRGQSTGGGLCGVAVRGDSPREETCVESQFEDTVHAGSLCGVAVRGHSPWQKARGAGVGVMFHPSAGSREMNAGDLLLSYLTRI